MSRLTLPLLIVLAVVVSVGLAWWVLTHDKRADASAEVSQDLAPFHAVEITGTAQVTLRQGEPERLAVEPLPAGARVQAVVRDGTLRLDVRNERHWWNGLFSGRQRPVRVTLGFRQVDRIDLSGTVSLRADGLSAPRLALNASGGTRVRITGLAADRLDVDGAGALKAEIAGRATEQHVSIAGAGEYDAARLSSDVANVDVSGVGRVSLDVARTLDADISGAGAIDYTGNPEVRRRVSGVGRIRHREAGA